jgi:KipI family sensor histidine kinase inhibitor
VGPRHDTPAHGERARSVELLPYGHLGTLVDFGDPRCVAPMMKALADAHPLARSVAGWQTVFVPRDVEAAALRRLAEAVEPSDDDELPAQVTVVDVVYDGDDLHDVAALLGVSADEVVELHTAPVYRVVFLGFCRGFPYLRGLHPRLAAVGRLSTPRLRVRAGAVAIAGGQAGVYPVDTPAGWRVLGHTNTTLFDPSRMPPSPLSPGAAVRFRAVEG